MEYCKETDCLICYEKINAELHTMCVNCKIFMHDECEKMYRGEKGYCKCPHCLEVGFIGVINVIDTTNE